MSSLFCAIPSVQEGDCFENRITLSQSGVHAPVRSGISGSVSEGGQTLSYCRVATKTTRTTVTPSSTPGRGGRSATSGEQVADQTLTRGQPGTGRFLRTRTPHPGGAEASNPHSLLRPGRRVPLRRTLHCDRLLAGPRATGLRSSGSFAWKRGMRSYFNIT